jgi:hypothetical protein
MSDREDIKTTDLAWDPIDVPCSLDNLYKCVKGRADGAIKWYFESKADKKMWAIWLRVISILLASAGALVPILSQIITDKNGDQIIAPAWASVALVLAGVLVALDRFLGCSSSWIRYISTELRLQKLLGEFQIDWQRERSQWKETGPDDEQIEAMFTLAKEFIQEVDKLIIEETNAWIAEFQTVLKQIGELAKMKEKTGKKS